MSKSISPEEYTKWGKWIGETEQNVPKDDLISRQAAVDAVQKYLEESYVTDSDVIAYEMAYVLNDIPRADAVEVRHAQWIEFDDDRISGRCSVCGWESHLYEDDVVGMPYCPNCGSRMDGE